MNETKTTDSLPLTSTKRYESSLDRFLRKGLSLSQEGEVIHSVEIPSYSHKKLIAYIDHLSDFRSRCHQVFTKAQSFVAVCMSEGKDSPERRDTVNRESRQVKIDLFKRVCNLLVHCQTVNEENIDLEQMVHQQNALFIASYEEKDFIRGDGGNGGPEGILKCPEVKSTEVDQLSLKVLRDFYYGLTIIYRKHAVWVMNSATHKELSKEFERKPEWGEGPANRNYLFGNEVIISEHLENYEIILGNLKMGYCVVEGEGPHLIRDVYSKKPDMELTSIRYAGGAVTNPEAIRVLKSRGGLIEEDRKSS